MTSCSRRDSETPCPVNVFWTLRSATHNFQASVCQRLFDHFISTHANSYLWRFSTGNCKWTDPWHPISMGTYWIRGIRDEVSKSLASPNAGTYSIVFNSSRTLSFYISCLSLNFDWFWVRMVHKYELVCDLYGVQQSEQGTCIVLAKLSCACVLWAHIAKGMSSMIYTCWCN